jgi:signal peptide peptidase SppA
VFNGKFINKQHFDAVISNVADNPQSLVTKVGSKAILNMEGTLVHKAGFLDAMCGIVGMDTLGNEFNKLVADMSIDHIILNWNSPGGSAIGTPELAELVYSARDKKRITSYIFGSMCSAAFFIGSAAHEIYSSSSLNSVGSIGVVTMHIDQSVADHAEGLSYTYIYAGKHKIEGNPHEKLSPEALANIQNKLDYSYGIFLDSVAKCRGVTSEEMSKYAEGQVFNAGQVVGTPLLDGITTLDEILRS